MSKLRRLFRESISLEKRKKLKKIFKYEGNPGDTYKGNKQYIQGFLSGQKKDIIPNQILIESLHGKNLDGHLFALIKELDKYEGYTTYIVSKNISEAKKMINSYRLQRIRVVEHLSYEYGLLLSTTEILINDNTFYPFFSKREEQKYYNFWHGTPLKTLGKDIEGEFTSFGNVTRNFMMADSVYLPNEFSVHHVLGSVELEGVLKSNVYISPSPRNSLLFDKKRGENIRKELGLEGKKIYIYMPTWRGKKTDKEVEFSEKEILLELEQNLPDNVVVFYKLHSMITSSSEFTGLKVKPYPVSYELYDFMSMVDGLITDYSSVMYDFASQNKPIVLFTYDYEEYINNRGLYEDIENYPFEKADNMQELVEILSSYKEVNYSQFVQDFCQKDSIDGTNEILTHILEGKSASTIEKFDYYNGKPNVYMFIGPLWDTGITAALKNLLKKIDLENNNYILCFEKKVINARGEEILKRLPNNVKFYPIEGIRILDSKEKRIHQAYTKEGNYTKFGQKLVDLQDREISRVFGDNIPDYYIHYTGFEAKYGEYVVFLKKHNTKTMIFVHTDMFMDYQNKKNYNKNLIEDAWLHADKLVLVNENLRQGFIERFPDKLNNITVANNFLGVDRIDELLKESFLDTFLNVRFHFRLLEESKENVFKALTKSFIENSVVKDQFIKQSIEEFSKNPIVKYADTKDKRIKMMNNYNLVYKLYECYVKEMYGENIASEFRSAAPEEQEAIKFIIELLRDDMNIAYFQRLYNNIQEYINTYYSSVDQITNEQQKDLSEKEYDQLAFELFKSDYGLRKMELLSELEDPEIKVFFNIGRFDQQKGHDRLVRAFEQVYEEDKNTRLYILASYGPVKGETIRQIKNSPAKEAITVLDRMDNPYLLLSKVDAFVMSSYYEGLGLVVYESMLVDTPVISVNLDTTVQFLEETDLILVDNSEEGLVSGMSRYLSGERPTTKFDFKKYENDRIEEFGRLFK